MSLNPNQHRAVTHPGGPTLVLAGAGAGKTRVLTERVGHLTRQGGVSPEHILVVTFTNKAAREMKERLQRLIGKEPVKQLWAGTFHSICCRILRQEIEKLGDGYNSRFIIYDPKDQEKAMDTVIRKLNLDPQKHKPSQMLYQLGKLKNAGLSSNAASNPLETKIFSAYKKSLQQHNALDFDDLLLLTLELLETQPKIRNAFQERFRHILVDEYQDTNTVQFELIRRLGEKHRNIFVVGDVDQSIYSFRHANFRIILRFQEDYPEAAIIKLEENYRSTGRILRAANDLIRYNQERFEKNLIPTRGPGEPIQFYQALHEDDESTYIVQQIQRLTGMENRSYGDFAILYRTNNQARLFEQKLIQHGIPYHVVGGFKFYDRREIKDILCYLQVIHNPQDSISLKRILNIPKRGIGSKTIETIETAAYFEGRGLTLWQALSNPAVRMQMSDKVSNTLQEFTSWMQELMTTRIPVSQLIERIFIESGYRAELEKVEDPKKKEDRMSNVEALTQAAVEFEESSNKPTDLGAFLERIALFSDTDKLKQDGRLVTLMTVHSAKGLEFPVVFIPGVEEGIIPHSRSIMEGETGAIEEERRLMYVALTRAKDRLFLIYTTNRRNKRATISNRLSRFLLEIQEHVKIPGELLVRTRQYLLQKQQAQGQQPIPSTEDLPKPTATTASVERQPVKQRIEIQAGDTVRHPIWGVGKVQKVVQRLANIDFPERGNKNIDWTKIPLEKLG